ncbi:MAG: 16S rRNA (guanine(527)-N(7))-methyltransferase RsmG [Myxococcales bacterium]|nr:16S rRNA (guanine(527)-N(7))-methyltransferase RsmG [Myxococcales bacterium]MCZ6714879.1 16S rRNA (guanine(527)-N(7))-methyltransferase RsmG [Deltaproteobacteria bacterium]MCZ6823459.1 16S rRNA (guanine(527)-N(7))-methyltransferase RsmG [Deltaproteobacteria bacterium]TDI97099.1 MAG: 16S rRNA (guanine(527)-N(7))-methyltransferase RsmG [Deltaproteobacteria bacterium]
MTQGPGPSSQARIERYLDELRKWAARSNLVGSTRNDALRRHVEDSLAAARHLPHDARVVDLGSGAGFPGLPLLIVRPDLKLTLVESRERRVHFLRQVVRVLELDCVVQRCRIEDAPAGVFAYALLRAVAPVQKALSLAAPWVKPGGEVWIWTREEPAAAGSAFVGEIPLGDRGRILRARAAAVSRGTP